MKTQSNKRHKLMTCLTASLIALAVAGTASADFTADCTLDGYVAMGGMTVNTVNDYLLPGWQNSPNTGPPQNMDTWGYAFLKFDANDLPGTIVDEAYLHLEVMALQDMTWPKTGTSTLGVFAVTADVAGIGYSTADAFRVSIVGTATDSISITGSGTFSEMVCLDVTDIVNEWINSGNNYGLVLATPGGLMPRLHSMETTSGADPVITNVPEPMTMAILGLGSLFTLVRRRR